MFANLGEAEEHASLKLLQEVRAAVFRRRYIPKTER